MKTQFNKEFNRTYILGTTNEIAGAVAKETAKRIKKDCSHFDFPNFDFTDVEEYDICADLRHTAEVSEGWYGCRDIITNFNDDYVRTIIADYYGGGAVSASSFWIDDCEEWLIRDAIFDVVSDTLRRNNYYDDSLILIAEVVGDIRSDSAEAARVAKIMECQNDIMEFDDGTYLNIRFNEDARKLEAGNVTNTGLYVTYSVDYDFDDSIYGNLSKLYDIISERKKN